MFRYVKLDSFKCKMQYRLFQFGDIALFLCSESAKNFTGTSIPVDGGYIIQ